MSNTKTAETKNFERIDQTERTGTTDARERLRRERRKGARGGVVAANDWRERVCAFCRSFSFFVSPYGVYGIFYADRPVYSAARDRDPTWRLCVGTRGPVPGGVRLAVLFRRRCLLFLVALLPGALLVSCALQAGQYAHGSDDRPWGNDSWQVDQAASTVTFTAQAVFNKPPGLVQIPVPIAHAISVRHVHGTVSLSVPKAGVNGSIIAMLRDQDGNALAAVKMQQFGDAMATVPIDATLSSDLPVTSLQVQYYVDMPGTQVVYMSITIN